jgi:hypothetical protein
MDDSNHRSSYEQSRDAWRDFDNHSGSDYLYRPLNPTSGLPLHIDPDVSPRRPGDWGEADLRALRFHAQGEDSTSPSLSQGWSRIIIAGVVVFVAVWLAIMIEGAITHFA